MDSPPIQKRLWQSIECKGTGKTETLQKVGIIPVMALPPHRYTEISHFVKPSEAVGYAIPECLGTFEFAALAEKVRREHKHVRWIFVAGQQLLPDSFTLSELLQVVAQIGDP